MFIAAKLFFPSFIQFIRVDTNVTSPVFFRSFLSLVCFRSFLFSFFFLITSGRFINILWVLIKQLFHSLVVYEIKANSALPASLAGICHLISNSLSWNNCVGCIALTGIAP